jgi:hypothetical protein
MRSLTNCQHDYLGEPGESNKWPHVSSSFGSFDLAGFAKAPAWWYRSWWLANISTADAGRPPLPSTDVFCHLVESWQPSVPQNGTRTLNVYTNAPFARILVNGVQIGSPVMNVASYGSAVFHGVGYVKGNVTAEALATDDPAALALASHTKWSWGVAAAIVLTVDVPSVTTGTGISVYLDGEDIALIRATIVDAAGVTVHTSTANVSFSVSGGPARVAGVGNGDPANHAPASGHSIHAYHGLARAVAKVTLKATGSAASRALETAVNVDAGAAGSASSKIVAGDVLVEGHFTVTAHVDSIPPVSVEVLLSTDPKDSVLNVAAASVGMADVGPP